MVLDGILYFLFPSKAMATGQGGSDQPAAGPSTPKSDASDGAYSPRENTGVTDVSEAEGEKLPFVCGLRKPRDSSTAPIAASSVLHRLLRDHCFRSLDNSTR